ncbi:MAG TPA: sigma 54-interacting transcriptional regulator [Candidatus Binataceae bacterium]
MSVAAKSDFTGSEPGSRLSEPSQLPPAAAGAPTYFHLLWDHELDSLAPILDSILSRREQVLAHWHRLYLLHFGDARSLSDREFMEIFGADLAATIGDLRAKDVDRFTADVRRIGEALAERRVPFPEIVVSMHLFEESATAAFPLFPPPLPKIYLAFDKLSHCRMIVLADAFFRSTAAIANARIRDLERESSMLPNQARSRFHGLVGANSAMRQLYERIEAAGRTRGTILIVGESGTGKELVARAIHEASDQPASPFVALNCAAIPRELIESELFGYKRGAFSGANAEHLGLFRSAEGGTLFLDEITEMSPETQTKLLRVLQERSVRPVGGNREIPVDTRVVATTNRDPAEAVRTAQLRADLYYRLQASVIRVPPLRERLDDVPLLIEHFINVFNERLKRRVPITGIAGDAMEAMQNYAWPGNVRELSNAIEGAFTFGRSSSIALDDLPPPLAGERRPQSPPPIDGTATASVASATDGVPAGLPSFADVERDLIRRALESTEGNKVQAAKLLRISRKKLYAKIEKYGLG